ncbi:ketol-acid reductoisomerase, partial [Candidatus Gottesmanbacteria bacterium]|nr:ketol-acid reductoisomerase [Candidatus Gottesmanbacteria bacterium]
MVKMKFGDVWKEIITLKEFPLAKARQVLKGETVAIIGYGVQGQTQALNLADNGIKVVVGQRKPSDSFDKAVKDGWKEGKNLFPIEEAARKGTIVAYLLSDAGQVAQWPIVKKYLTPGKTLYFSHGFGIVYKKQTKIVPPKDVDIIMVAPFDLGRSMRQKFLKGQLINSSFAIYQDTTGKAKEKVLAIGIGIGCGVFLPTTFEKEVYSDLTSERGVLLGALAGIIEAQYEELRKNGHSAKEAFFATVEELTQNIIPFIGDRGMDFTFANSSTTAQRGALDWKEEFKKSVRPVFRKLYIRVKKGIETK